MEEVLKIILWDVFKRGQRHFGQLFISLGPDELENWFCWCSSLQLPFLYYTAGSPYYCTAQDSLNGEHLTAHFEVHLEKHAKGRKRIQEQYTIR